MKTATAQEVKNIQAAQPTVKLLEFINPKAPILRLRCEDCENTFTHDTAFILRMIRSTGFFIPSSFCRKCRALKHKSSTGKAKKVRGNNRKKPEALKPLKTSTNQSSKPKSETEAQKVKQPKSARKPTPLTHRPFEALKDLKTEK